LVLGRGNEKDMEILLSLLGVAVIYAMVILMLIKWNNEI